MLLELVCQDKDIVVVIIDVRGFVILGDFVKELFVQFVECGIVEQDVVGILVGLVYSGKKVFVCGLVCFYVVCSLEQVKVDLVYSQNNVKIFGVSGGVVYGVLGVIYYSLYDIVVLRIFLGMNIVFFCDVCQICKLVKLLVDYFELVYVCVGRVVVFDVYENDDFEFVLGKVNMLLDGMDLIIIVVGEMVYYVYQVGLMLCEKGIQVCVLDMFFIKFVDVEVIRKVVEEIG